MLELIKFVVGAFAEYKDEVQYDVVDDGKNATVTITLKPSDMGKVIGRQGKIAKALRTLVRAYSQKNKKKVIVEIKEKAE